MKRIIFSFCLLIVTALQAELLILKKTAEGLAALTHDESLRHGPVISQIILKYQWPMCIASDLTKEEKDELLTPGIPNAEEIFIQKKLRQAISELDIQIAFIPTTLYELFCIYQYVQSSEEPLKAEAIDFSKSSFERAAMVLVSEYISNFSSDFKHNLKFRSVVRDKSWQGMFNKKLTKSEIYDVFNAYNQLFFDTTMTVQLPFNAHKDLVPLFKKEDMSAFMYINNAIIDYLLQDNGLKLDVSYITESQSNIVLDSLIKDFLKLKINTALFTLTDHISLPNIFENISSQYNFAGLQKDQTVIAKIIQIDYQARQQNKALLIRGSNILFWKTLREKYIGTIRNDDIENIIGSIIPYDVADLYSVSFGQSLFAGSMLDAGACPYSFLQDKFNQKNAGYVLLVDKKEYVKSQNNDLFFIPSLSPLVALFGYGEFFHARTKVAISGYKHAIFGLENFFHEKIENQLDYNRWIDYIIENNCKIKIKGIKNKLIPYHSLLMNRKSSWLQAELFSDFVAENGIVLNFEERQAKKIIEDQKKLADVYAKAQEVESTWNKWKEFSFIRKAAKAKTI